MATVRNVMARLVDLVEAVTPDTPRYDGSPSFRHASRAYDSEDAKDYQSPSRRFLLLPTGDRETTGAMGAIGSPISVRQTFDVVLNYRQGSDAEELLSVALEDIDRIGWHLMQPSKWNTPTDVSISRVLVEDFALDIDEAGPNGVAVVTIPVDVTYKPSFTG